MVYPIAPKVLEYRAAGNALSLIHIYSIFAVSSIAMAKAYYLEFKRQMQDLPEAKRLRVATIFSYAANEDVEDANGLLGEENSDDTSQLDASSRDFLESAIKDYNALFKTHYDTSADRFQNYYKGRT